VTATPDGRKLFVVYLNGAEDPMDRSYQQPVRGTLVFTDSNGELSAFFDLSAVRDWREADEAELLE
jgi:hypothetical protein